MSQHRWTGSQSLIRDTRERCVHVCARDDLIPVFIISNFLCTDLPKIGSSPSCTSSQSVLIGRILSFPLGLMGSACAACAWRQLSCVKHSRPRPVCGECLCRSSHAHL